jgi:hypothetical protein
MGAGYFHVGEKIHLLTYLTTHAKKWVCTSNWKTAFSQLFK